MSKLGKSPRYKQGMYSLSNQKTIYVRKKFLGKRKWVPIGDLQKNGDINIYLTPLMMDALLSSEASESEYFYMGMSKDEKKELTKLFDNKHVQKPVFCYEKPKKCK